MKFEDVLEIKNGRNQKAVETPNGKYPIYGSGGVMGYAKDYICEGQTIVIGRKGSINNPIFVEEPFWNVDTAFGLIADRSVLLPRYLYYFCKKFNFESLNKTVTIPSLTKSDLLKIEIALPNLERQQEISDTLQQIEQVISLRKQELQKLDELVKARFFGTIITQFHDFVNLFCAKKPSSSDRCRIPKIQEKRLLSCYANRWLRRPSRGTKKRRPALRICAFLSKSK